MKYILIILFILGLLYNPHKCSWEDCEQTGGFWFKSTWGYEPHTAGYDVEYWHYKNPSWSYEQCELKVLSK